MTKNIENSLVRVLGYIFLSTILGTYIISEGRVISDVSSKMLIFTLLYLGGTFLIEFCQKDSRSNLVHYIMLFMDSIVCGAFIYFIRADLSLSFMLLIIQSYIFVSAGGIAFWFIYMASTLSTCCLFLFVGFDFYMRSTNDFMVFAGGLYTLIFVVSVSQQRYEKTVQLIESRELEKIKTEEMEKLFGVLSNYLSPQLIHRIQESKGEILPAKRKQITACFTDIVGFSSMAETHVSEITAKFLNCYFEEMSKVALKHGGTIDKYLGDGMLVFFGDPLTKGVKEDAISAIAMAVEMQKRIIELHSTFQELGMTNPIKIRIGINTGFCHVGNFGSNNRMDYTVVGNSVNIASRLESITKPGEITVGESTFVLAKDSFRFKPRGKTSLKGLSLPFMPYQVFQEEKMEHETIEVEGLVVSLKGTQKQIERFKGEIGSGHQV